MEDEETPVIKVHSVVVLAAGSVAMDVRDIVDGVATCAWENRAGELIIEEHPVADLAIWDGNNAVPEAF